MKKIIFVCHGSICRSPAAEFIMKSLTNDFEITSRATSYEEIGNDIYPPMKRELTRQGIKFSAHHASRITKQDYDSADYIFYMDDENKWGLTRILGNNIPKCMPIYCFTKGINEIEDPWYSDNYEKVVNELRICIKDILDNIKK